jgi:uncharacterized protein YfdQ (DUF2303 family)
MSYTPPTPAQPVAPAAGDVRALLKAGTALAEPKKNPEPDGRPFVVLPEGFAVQALPVKGFPDRAAGLVKLRDAASLIQYVDDHKGATTRIYATLEPACFLAVFDDFLPGAGVDLASAANWRQWRAQFLVPHSREWQIWNKHHKVQLSQLQFGEFLQDNLPDVVSPDGATLLEMSLNFEASQNGAFRSVQRLHDGSHNMLWAAENNASGSVKLPPEITVSIPVFENDVRHTLTARLRHRVNDGKLALWYELVRPHKVLEQAFMGTWEKVKVATGVSILLGSPE